MAAAVPVPVSPVRPRSPYGLDERLEGERVALVRPYLVACEERARQGERQGERRRALCYAVQGIDVGPEWIHGVRVGAAS